MRFKDLAFGQRFGKEHRDGPSMQKTNTYYDSAGNPVNTIAPGGYLEFTNPEAEVVAFVREEQFKMSDFAGKICIKTQERYRYAH